MGSVLNRSRGRVVVMIVQQLALKVLFIVLSLTFLIYKKNSQRGVR